MTGLIKVVFRPGLTRLEHVLRAVDRLLDCFYFCPEHTSVTSSARGCHDIARMFQERNQTENKGFEALRPLVQSWKNALRAEKGRNKP
jgi:hypothetical protein